MHRKRKKKKINKIKIRWGWAGDTQCMYSVPPEWTPTQRQKKEKHTSSYLYAANEVPNTLPVLAEGEPIASAFPLPVQFNPSWAQSNACGNCGGRGGALSDTTDVAKLKSCNVYSYTE